MVTFIVAAAENDAIGLHGDLPWRLPDDFKYFKQQTLGRPIIMGRKTFESLGKPLPNRPNLIVTRQAGYHPAGTQVFATPEEAIAYARQLDHSEEVFIIGGAELFRQLLTRADRILLTRVHAEVAGDTFFPVLASTEWAEVARHDHPADARHQYAFSFLDLRRVGAHPLGA